MYVLPKGLESLWIVATGKVGLKRWRGGESLLTAIGMAMVMVCSFSKFLMESLSSNWNCHPSVTEHLSKRPSASFRIGSKDTISVYRAKLSNDLYEWRTPLLYLPLSMRPLLVLCLKLFTSSVPEMNRELRYLERRMTGWQNNCNVTLHVDRVSGGSKKKQILVLATTPRMVALGSPFQCLTYTLLILPLLLLTTYFLAAFPTPPEAVFLHASLASLPNGSLARKIYPGK